MGKRRVFTKMVSAEAKYQPAVRIQFKGKYQVDYFTLANAAEEMETSQTNLGRLIISDWLKQWREKKGNGKGAQQMVMLLKGSKSNSAKPAGGKPVKGGKVQNDKV